MILPNSVSVQRTSSLNCAAIVSRSSAGHVSQAPRAWDMSNNAKTSSDVEETSLTATVVLELLFYASEVTYRRYRASEIAFDLAVF